MKTTNCKVLGKAAFLGVLLATANVVVAQSALTTTTTTSAGTVRDFSPDTFTVVTTASPAPIRYSYSKTTTYVDENGNPVAMETVKSGAPVTVYYSGDGDSRVASKVVVRKSVDVSPEGTTRMTTTTATTSSQGTVSSFNPDAIAVKTDATAAPVTYSFSKTVSYVDENGNPVSVETVKSGVPVTVYYDQEGGHMVANRVVVRSTAQPDGTVIEHKKTTTTTTETNPNP